jgi:hypothetical protein
VARAQLLRDLQEHLQFLGAVIHFMYLFTSRAPHDTIWKLTLLRHHLAYTYVHLRGTRSCRTFRPFLQHPTLLPDTPTPDCTYHAVYLFLGIASNASYIGKDSRFPRRLFQHLLVLRDTTQIDTASASDGIWQQTLRTAGIGAFVHLTLFVQRAPPVTSPLAPLAAAALSRTERWFIVTLASRDPATKNTDMTWLAHARHSRLLTIADTNRLRPAGYPGLHGRGQGSSSTRFHRYTLAAEDGSRIIIYDLYVALRKLARLPTSHFPITLSVVHGDTDITRWRAMERYLGVFRLTPRHATASRDESQLDISGLRENITATTRQLHIDAVTRDPHELDPYHRRLLARLGYSAAARQNATEHGSVSWFVSLYSLANRHPDKRKREQRRASVVTLCRAAHGLHPRLDHVTSVPTPLLVTKTVLRSLASTVLQHFSPLSTRCTTLLARRHRIVFSTVGKLQDLLVNEYPTAQAHLHGPDRLRACTCQHDALPTSLWRDDHGCVTFTSSEYPEDGPYADIIRQSASTVMYPEHDDTLTTLAQSLHSILGRIHAADRHEAPALRDVIQFMRTEQRRLSNSDRSHAQPRAPRTPPTVPPHCNLRRAHALRAHLRDIGLVCGRADHGNGQLYFMCVRRFDRLTPSVFDPTDTSKFTVMHDTREHLLAEATAFAARFRHIAPVNTSPSADLGSWTQSLKAARKYTGTPKYHMKVRPISNHRNQPFARLASILGKALGWLIRTASEAGLMPWVVTRTFELVPMLHRMVEDAHQHFGTLEGVRWRHAQGDCSGFF